MSDFLWPVNWRDGVEEILSYKTEVQTGRSGAEMRIAWRRSPRRNLAFTVTAENSDRQKIEAFLRQTRKQDIRIVDPTDPAQPWLTGRMAASLTAQDFTSKVAEYSCSFAVKPTSEVNATISSAPLSFNGRELLSLKPNFAQPLDLTILNPREDIDYGMGATTFNFPIDFASRIVQMGFVGGTYAEVLAIKDIFRRALGQRGELYIPSFTDDLVPMGSYSGSSFTVAGSEIISGYAGSTVEKAVLLRPPGGPDVARIVSGITASGGNSVIATATALPYTVTPDTDISWLRVHRFASDDLTISWKTSTVAEITTSFMTLEDL